MPSSSGSAAVTLTGYVRILQSRLAVRTTESPEALLADLVPDLIRSLAPACGREGVDLLGQAYEAEIGRPDFSVRDGPLLVGHVETKPPGKGADVGAFRGAHDRGQWKRFQQLPNLLYTDGTAFGLYRSGRSEGPVLELRFDEHDPDQEAEPNEAARLVALLTRFLSWRAVPPHSLASLADQLAPLCAVLRDAVRGQLEDPSTEVAKASTEFGQALFPDRSLDEIADAFAQVCTYSMLLARAAGATRLDGTGIEQALRRGHPVLGRIVRVLVDEGTERELGWALETVRTLIEVIDFDRLRGGRLLPGMTHHDQTWLYFYETFLARYDPRLRDQYGVYYTPQQVIGAQVALVDEVLRRRLALNLGLASPEVTVLDPAVGTGSYPIRVLTSAARTATEALGEQAVPGVVRGLASRMYAFEVLAGPYAVAHLRVSETLEDLSGGDERQAVHVYLTDTLSSPHAEPTQLTRLLDPLVEEQRQALRVKSEAPVMVCLGNPPYERGRRTDVTGEAGGGWVVDGGGGGARPIFDDLLEPVRAAGFGVDAKNLYNDYVYFWRWALWKVFERPDASGFSDDPGVVSLITASSYLGGRAFVGLREHLRRACDEIWILDLGGEGRGARREQNVFAIQTPVAIAVAVRSGTTYSEVPAIVRYARISGDRESKLARLEALASVSEVEWEDCPTGWADPFLPEAGAEWTQMPAITALFPWQHSGVQGKRTWPIAPEPEVLPLRWAALLEAGEQAAAFRETPDRKLTSTPPSLTGGERPPAVADVPAATAAPPTVRYAYRAFDRQWLIADSRLLDRPRPELWRSLSERQVFMVSFLTEVLGEGPAAVATAYLPDLHHFRGSFGGRHVIPLYRDAAHTPNVDPEIVAALRTTLDRDVAPEELFAYAYAVLSTPRYTERFFAHLAQPGPRLPITASADLFARMAGLGTELLWLHTYGQRMTGPDRPAGEVPRGSARVVAEVPPGEADFPVDFDYDPGSEALGVGSGRIAPVRARVWEWSLSGFPVVASWLRYRMRDGAGRAARSHSPLDRIRPSSWPARYTTELLELLWVLEATVALEQEHADLLDEIVEGALFSLRASL